MGTAAGVSADERLATQPTRQLRERQPRGLDEVGGLEASLEDLVSAAVETIWQQVRAYAGSPDAHRLSRVLSISISPAQAQTLGCVSLRVLRGGAVLTCRAT